MAVPAVIAFNFFNRKLKSVLAGTDEIAHAVLAEIHSQAEHD